MTTSLRFWWFTVACALWAATASAQQPASPPPSSSDSSRLALTTADGDTGLWFVPTAEVLARGKWSASGYRVGRNYVQGFSNVADFPLTVGVGLGRAEIFGAFKAVTRVDRDVRPIFTTNTDNGGVIGTYPYVWKGWTGSKVGDLLVGAKINLLSEANQAPAAVAIRGTVKIPTGDKDAGVSTGKTDGFVDFIVSKELHGVAEIAGYGGGSFRSSTSDVTQSKGLRWGIGAGFPSRGPFHITTELNGEKPFDDVVELSAPIVGEDGTRAPNNSSLRTFTTASVGATLQLPNGVFFGAGASWNLPREDRSKFRTQDNTFGDWVDLQVRIGYHPGVRRYVAPPPPAPAAPTPPPPPPPNRPPSLVETPGAQNGITASKDTVAPGESIQLTARGQDADGDNLTYRWTAPTGTFSTPNQASTLWTAPDNFTGDVPLTVTIDDGKGGTTSSTRIVHVERPAPAAPVVELTFEDVYFDFDRSTLRPEALRLLDDAVAKLQANPGKNMIIEGHTCNIGTSEYNLALGERRAQGVLNYLTSRGIPASRLETVSYGEERPKFDNSREETRRLNRRAALVIKVQ